jgi:probable phosphoglycerate mutase
MASPMKTVVWLVRHGESLWAAEDRFNGRGDVDLTERGRRQARRLADRLSARPIAALYSSPLRRCLETASLLAAPHGLQPIPVEDLAELDFGLWDGMLRGEIVAQYPEQWAAWVADPATVAPPGGETAYAALSRAAAALRRIVARQAGQEIVVVAHKAINRLLLCDLLGIPPRTYRARLGQRPCALNCIEWEDGQAMVTLVNDVCHDVEQ